MTNNTTRHLAAVTTDRQTAEQQSLSSDLFMPSRMCDWTARPTITEQEARQAADHHTTADYARAAQPATYGRECRRIGSHAADCQATAEPELPDSAVESTEFDSLGTRCVYGPAATVAKATVRAAAIQTHTGTICDDPTPDEAPHLLLHSDEQPISPTQARLLAQQLVRAADQADLWAAARQRHPARHTR